MHEWSICVFVIDPPESGQYTFPQSAAPTNYRY